MMRSLSSIVLAVALCACGDSLSVSNTSPEGSVGGLVVDASSRQPIAGATVVLIAGGQVFTEISTGDDGTFRFSGVPFGNVLVLVTPPSGSAFAGATVAGTLTGEAGEFPVGNESLTLGPVGLVPIATQPFQFRVLDEAGTPVEGYEVGASTTVEWVDFSGGAGVPVGERLFSAITDADGFASIAGLPLYHRLSSSVNDALIVALPPYDADDDGLFEFPGGAHVFSLLSLGDPSPDVILDPGYLTQLQIQASTIGTLEPGGTVGTPVPTVIETFDPVFVKFNLPIQPSVTAVIVDEKGLSQTAPTVTVKGDTLSMAYSGLAAGAEYNIWFHVVAKLGDRLVSADFAGTFFTRPTAQEVTANLDRSPDGNSIIATFSEPVGLGTTGLSSSGLSGANCVLFFNADLGGNPLPIGDHAGELSNPHCYNTPTFHSIEPDPVGPVGQSGYSTLWQFGIPTHENTTPLPPATPVHILFSRVPDPQFRMKRADGRLVTDFTGTMRTLLLP